MPSETLATTPWSLATVKAMIVTATSTEDARLIRIADGVAALLERLCHRYFVTRARVEVHGFDVTAHILFTEMTPVVALTSISIVRYPTADAETMDLTTGVTIDRGLGKIWAYNDIFNKGVGNITVTYTTGYGTKDSTDLQAHPVWNVGLDLIKFLFDEQRTGGQAASSVSIGPQTFMIKPSWPKQILLGIDSMKLVM